MAAFDRPTRRGLIKAGGAIVVAFGAARLWPRVAWADAADAAGASGAPPAPAKPLDPHLVDSFLAIDAQGRVTVYSGKVDLGQGLRVAIPQMVAEELSIPIDRIRLIEGDTALTPDQGPTSGSSGVAKGGVTIRQAAATARQALLKLGGDFFGMPPDRLRLEGGRIKPPEGGDGLSFGQVIGGRRFELSLDPKAPLKDPRSYTVVGRPVPRPDLPAKITGRHVFMHDFRVAGMLHGRVIRPPAIGAKLLAFDAASIAGIPGARVVRIENFLGVVAEDEWAATRAAASLEAKWSDWAGLPDWNALEQVVRGGPVQSTEVLAAKGDAAAAFKGAPRKFAASYYWPPQSHASMGPSCAIADVGTDHATIWTASQATHKFRPAFAHMLGLPVARLRLIYLDGSGCYGMNGHEDAAADAALLSKATGRPVRVQWSRADELGWDPKGPPQLIDLRAGLDAQGHVGAWETALWLPEATRGLPNVPLLAPAAAGIGQPQGIAAGLMSQNAVPPYDIPAIGATVHWLADTPLRPAHIRAPGKIANSFAVESFTDELAAAARIDPVEFRLRAMQDPRAIEVLRLAAARFGWATRPSPQPPAPKQGPIAVGRGIAYVHYKQHENHVAMAIEVAVDRSHGTIRVRRVVCAHDCGLVINPNAIKQQIEGCILQTLSRALHEQVVFDRSRVTSVDWASYPILSFAEVPEIVIELVDRPHDPPFGAGEAASAPVAAALGNAVFDAVGIRLRRVPFTPLRVQAALDAAAKSVVAKH